MDGIKIRETIQQPVARRYMAKAMLNVWNNVPHFVQMANASAENLIKIKQETGRTYNDILIKCLINTVKNYPNVNSTLEGDNWIIYEDINVSVAMISDLGLFVPVIKNAENMNVDEIAAEVKAFSEKVKKGVLMPDEQALGTITISNLGATGVETGFPIINSPQGALVFIGNIRKIPVVDENDSIVIGHEIGYGIAYDHRFIDGMIGQAFTTGFKNEIENLTKGALY
jgi:pyruvate dehydrogenase E2 component (dihydrolipoamide acetyltransferase)